MTGSDHEWSFAIIWAKVRWGRDRLPQFGNFGRQADLCREVIERQLGAQADLQLFYGPNLAANTDKGGLVLMGFNDIKSSEASGFV